MRMAPPTPPSSGAAAAIGVVVYVDRVGDTAVKPLHGHVPQPQRGGEQQLPAVGGQYPGHGHAHPQQPEAIHLIFVQKPLQLPVQRLVEPVGGIEGRDLIGHLPQEQVRHRQPEPVVRDGYAHGQPGLRHDGQPLGAPAAGGLPLAGVAHQPHVHQIVHVLVYRGHAQTQGPGQVLLGAKAPGPVQIAVYAPPGRGSCGPPAAVVVHAVSSISTA